MNPLETLSSEDFDVEVGPLLPAPALRRRLLAMPQVQAVKAVAGETIAAHVAPMMQSFKAGKRCEHDLALAALAVAIEDRASDFATDYLEVLSRLRVSELPTAPRVAAECLAHRGMQT